MIPSATRRSSQVGRVRRKVVGCQVDPCRDEAIATGADGRTEVSPATGDPGSSVPPTSC